MAQNLVLQEAEERRRQALLAEEGTEGGGLMGLMETQEQEEGAGMIGNDDMYFPAWRLGLRRVVHHDHFQVSTTVVWCNT